MSELRTKDTSNVNFLHLHRDEDTQSKFGLSIDKNKIISCLLIVHFTSQPNLATV